MNTSADFKLTMRLLAQPVLVTAVGIASGLSWVLLTYFGYQTALGCDEDAFLGCVGWFVFGAVVVCFVNILGIRTLLSKQQVKKSWLWSIIAHITFVVLAAIDKQRNDAMDYMDNPAFLIIASYIAVMTVFTVGLVLWQRFDSGRQDK